MIITYFYGTIVLVSRSHAHCRIIIVIFAFSLLICSSVSLILFSFFFAFFSLYQAEQIRRSELLRLRIDALSRDGPVGLTDLYYRLNQANAQIYRGRVQGKSSALTGICLVLSQALYQCLISVLYADSTIAMGFHSIF